jgi:putative ABC transport system permease protein
VLFALIPAWRPSREKATGVLNEGAGHATTPFGRHGLRHALVAGEIGLALVLLVAAGLFINSFVRLRGIDPGFQPEDVVTMPLRLGPGYDTREDRLAFYDPLLDRLRDIPGVQSASLSTGLPFLGGRAIAVVHVEGDERAPGERERLDFSVITPDYFRTLQIAMLDGRDLLSTDDANHEDVMIVNEAFARKHWPAESAVGKRVRIGGSDDWINIVGVVANIRRFALDQNADPEGFFPLRQARLGGGVNVAVRASGNTAAVMSAMRRAAWDLNPNLPLNTSTLNQELAGSITTPRFHTLVLSGFAAIALTLAAVGIYGTMSYTVGQRTRELGIRMALGAAAPDVIGLVVRQGLVLIVVGVLIGIGGALAASRILASFLYGVSATDMMTFSVGAAVLTLVALAASYIPARRATSVDCMQTLRQE